MKRTAVFSIALALSGCAAEDLDRGGSFATTNRVAARSRAMVSDIGSKAQPNIAFVGNKYVGSVEVGLDGGYEFGVNFADFDDPAKYETAGNVKYIDDLEISGGPLADMKEEFIAQYKAANDGTGPNALQTAAIDRMFEVLSEQSLADRAEILYALGAMSGNPKYSESDGAIFWETMVSITPEGEGGPGPGNDPDHEYCGPWCQTLGVLLYMFNDMNQAQREAFIASVKESSNEPMLRDATGRVAVWDTAKSVRDSFAGARLQYSGFGYVSVKDFDPSYGKDPVQLDYHGFTYGNQARFIADAASIGGHSLSTRATSMTFAGAAIGGINQLKENKDGDVIGQISADLVGTSKFYLDLSNPSNSRLQLDFASVLGKTANGFSVLFNNSANGATITKNFGAGSDFVPLVPVRQSGKYDAKLYGANGNPTEAVGSFRYSDRLTIIGGAFGGVKTAQTDGAESRPPSSRP